MLEHSIYKKVPLNKKRGDSRQGTIDQDPEFMAFLEELANPPGPKEAGADGEDADVDQKVTTTPLVEFLKEKKAAKSKEAANKKREAKNKSNATTAKEEDNSKKRSKDGKDTKADKSTKEPIKILSKKAATPSAAESGKKATAKSPAAPEPAVDDAPKSRRAGIAAAAKILQREQGLSPGTAHRKARQEAAKPEANATTKAAGGKDKTAAPADGNDAETPDANKSRPSTPTGKQQNTRKRGGKAAEKKAAAETPAPTPTILKPPIILKKKPEDTHAAKATPDAAAAAPATTSPPAASTSAPATTKATSQANAKSGSKSGAGKKQTVVVQDGTRGFVRHVNSSQGITDATLREALSAFGTVTSVDVDKRKAFAYVDFSDADGLTKAIAASPVSVAQGTVTIMERKEKKPTPAPAGTTATGSGTPAAANNEKKDDKEKERDKPAGRGRRGRGGGGGGKASAGAATASAGDGNNSTPATATGGQAPPPASSGGSG